MSEAPTICAVVLTLDEELLIDQCLASLQWCDDLVVVDSGSTDGTVAKAQAAGARVLVHRTDGPFHISDQRNWALDHGHITATWVLFVDADEVVTPALAAQVRQACGSATDVVAFQLAPKYLFWGTWMKRSMRYPNWHDRLLRHGCVRLDGGTWEHFSAGTRSNRLTEPYLHYGNSKGFGEWLARHDRYSTWEADHVLRYLAGEGDGAFGTLRKLRARRVAARMWPIRPVVRFLVMYVVRGGFLDGPAALPFCLRYAVYEYMIVEKIAEGRRLDAGEPL